MRGILNDAYPIFFSDSFTNAYVVDAHLNCLDLSRQFKSVLTTYAFIKKYRLKYTVCNLKTTTLLDFALTYIGVCMVIRSNMIFAVYLYPNFHLSSHLLSTKRTATVSLSNAYHVYLNTGTSEHLAQCLH